MVASFERIVLIWRSQSLSLIYLAQNNISFW